jgi:hypothetical protein
MPRRKNPFRPKRLPLTLIEQTHDLLNRLVKTGAYGNNTTEAVKIILMRHLQELEGRGKVDYFKEWKEAETGNKK